MPWPWKLARDCLNLQTGQINIYPLSGAYLENELVIDMMNVVWYVWTLFSKPQHIEKAGETVVNWTPADIDLFDYLQSNAWDDD